jgi:MFS family permease
MTHSSIATLRSFRGNARGCVYTEALWGIPFNLYAPYVSVYMLALGLTDAQIGLITSIGLAFQVFWALVSGAITDKVGRRRTTLITDLVSWSIPCLIWAFSQNFWWFLVAAIFNAVWRVSQNSWTCLLVEDTNPVLLVEVYSWIYIANVIVAFIAPFSGLLIEKFTLVPAMRILFLFAFVMMTIKFFATNAMTTETQRGRIRMQETRGQPLFSILSGSAGVLKQVVQSPVILATTGVMIILSISRMIQGTFWSILATEKLGVPDQWLAVYFSARSLVMLLMFFLVMPRFRNMGVHKPMFFGFIGLMLSQLLLITLPPGSYWLLMVATLMEACSLPVASALLDKLVVLVVDPKERARIMAIVYVIVIVFTSPFGWIAGQMSQVNRTLPFVLSIALYAIGGLLILVEGRLERVHGMPDQAAA